MSELVRNKVIIVVAAIVFFTNLGAPRLWDDDEPKNAGCAVEMLQRGDWMVPWFNGELRTHKPILLYWFMLSAYQVLGVTEFAARFWSAVCGVGTVLLTYQIGRRLFNASVGMWASLLLCGSLMFVVASRAATPDSLLIFFSTLALWIFVCHCPSFGQDSSSAEGLPHKETTYLWMYAAMSVAVLAKGPIGMLLPTAVIGCFLLCVNRVEINTFSGVSRIQCIVLSVATWLIRTFWPRRILQYASKMRLMTAVAMFALVALPWYLAVGILTDGAWLEGFLFTHNIGRYLAPMEGHGGPPMYHLLSIAIGFFPVSVFLAPSVLHLVGQLRSGGHWQSGYIFAASWIAVYVVFFSFAGTKLPSYVTPCYPALALLVGALMHHWAQRCEAVPRFWSNVATGTLALAGSGILVGLWLAAEQLVPGEQSIALVGVIPVAAAACCWILIRLRQTQLAAGMFVLSSVALTTAIFSWAALRVDQFQHAKPMISAIEEHSSGKADIVAYRAFRPSWVFYAGKPLPILKKSKTMRDFLADHPDTYIITHESRWDELRDVLPESYDVVTRRHRFLKKGQYVVAGPTNMVSTAMRPSENSGRRSGMHK